MARCENKVNKYVHGFSWVLERRVLGQRPPQGKGLDRGQGKTQRVVTGSAFLCIKYFFGPPQQINFDYNDNLFLKIMRQIHDL